MAITWKAPPRNVGRFWESSALRDVQFLRSWLEYDSEFEAKLAARGINWNAVLGLALASVVSVTFWAGMAVILAHLWK
jgi:hypothetical protein